MKSKPFGALFGLLALVAILSIAPAFGQTANEIDMASGAGASAGAACVAANNCFAPNPLTVAPGTTVTWKNTDTVSHYVTSGKASDETTGTVFDSGNLIKPGSTYQFTFANAGTFDYFCSVHPWMTGQVIVASAAADITQSSGSMQAGSMNMTTSQSSNMSQTGSMNMTQPSNTPVQTGSMNMEVGQSSDNAMHTGVENTTTSQSTETVANTGSASVTESNNSPTETNNAQPTAPTNTQYVSAPVVNTTSAPSDAQTSAWIAGIVIVAIMSGVGIWSTARRK